MLKSNLIQSTEFGTAVARRLKRALAGKNVKKRPLSEPIRLWDFENSAPSLTEKKINVVIYGTRDVSKVKIARAISYG